MQLKTVILVIMMQISKSSSNVNSNVLWWTYMMGDEINCAGLMEGVKEIWALLRGGKINHTVAFPLIFAPTLP